VAGAVGPAATRDLAVGAARRAAVPAAPAASRAPTAVVLARWAEAGAVGPAATPPTAADWAGWGAVVAAAPVARPLLMAAEPADQGVVAAAPAASLQRTAVALARSREGAAVGASAAQAASRLDPRAREEAQAVESRAASPALRPAAAAVPTAEVAVRVGLRVAPRAPALRPGAAPLRPRPRSQVDQVASSLSPLAALAAKPADAQAPPPVAAAARPRPARQSAGAGSIPPHPTAAPQTVQAETQVVSPALRLGAVVAGPQGPDPVAAEAVPNLALRPAGGPEVRYARAVATRRRLEAGEVEASARRAHVEGTAAASPDPLLASPRRRRMRGPSPSRRTAPVRARGPDRPPSAVTAWRLSAPAPHHPRPEVEGEPSHPRRRAVAASRPRPGIRSHGGSDRSSS
jgi:hypothetical protein